MRFNPEKVLLTIFDPPPSGGDNLTQQKITEAITFIGNYMIYNYEDIEEEYHLLDIVLSNLYDPPADRKINGKHWVLRDYADESSKTGVINKGKWHIPKKKAIKNQYSIKHCLQICLLCRSLEVKAMIGTRSIP